MRPRIQAHALYLALVAVPAVCLDVLALVTASGVTRLSETEYHTEFVEGAWWYASGLLVIPVFLAARNLRSAGTIAAVVLAAVPQFVTMAVVVERYAASGWGDGLEYLGYGISLLMTIAFVVAAAIGAATRPVNPP